MPLMTQIRNNLSKAFAAFAAVFIVYIVLDWGMDLTGRKGMRGKEEVLGEVNGKVIEYKVFSEALRRTLEQQKKQAGTDLDDETERQARSQVWSSMVDEILIEKELDRLGITVTDQELVDWVQGPNPPDFLVNQFKDSTGTFRRDAYYAAMRDPQNRQAWVQVEEVLRQQRKREKLQSLLLSTVLATEPEIRQRFLDRTESLDAEFALFDVNRVVPDSAVTVTDQDLKDYYNTHQEDFKVKAGRKLKYVVFVQSPSESDSAAVLNDLTRLREQIRSGLDFMDLAKSYSDNPVTQAFFKHGEMSRIKDNAVFAAKKGDVVGPIADADGYHLIKILDEKEGTTQYVRASHILFNLVSGADSVNVIAKAKNIAREAKTGANFAELARKNSQEYGADKSGGDLGWAAKGTWVKPFEDAVFRARVGDIVGPVRTPFGWHIIKVTGRDKREVKIADLIMRIKASNKTIDDAFNRAQDFGILSKDEGFEKQAEFTHSQVLETPMFAKGSYVPGIGMNDAVMNFAFASKLGAISDPTTISNGVAIFKVTEMREDGIRAFDDAKASIRNPVLREKKLAVIKDQAEKFYASLNPAVDLVDAAKQFPLVTAMKTGPFTPTGTVGGVGRDPKFIGEALMLKPGEISKSFDGARGYYIVKLISRTPFDTTRYASEHNTLRDQILQEKKSRFMNEWMTALRDKADIVDNRQKFYR
jgi:peptidyl-prolyl cis-trans isomerase D